MKRNERKKKYRMMNGRKAIHSTGFDILQVHNNNNSNNTNKKGLQ